MQEELTEPKTEEQLKAERIKEQNRIRSARRYEKKRMEINEARRLQYQEKTKTEEKPKKESKPKKEPKPKVEKPKPEKIAPTMINGFDQSRNDLFLQKLQALDINQYTKAKYVGDFKRLLAVIEYTDILENMRRGLNLIQLIEDSDYATNTKRGMVQLCLYMITQFQLKINKNSLKSLKNYFDATKVNALEENEEKMKYESVPTWPEYVAQIKEKFGEDSKMYLLVKMYQEVTLRDDFILKIVPKKPKETDENFLVLGKNNYQLVINTYKTDARYGQLTLKLTKGLTALITRYMKLNNLSVGDYLFGENKLSSYISSQTNRAGMLGSINLFRHMSVSASLSNSPSLSSRQELADKMRHSVFTQLKYIRQYG